jgi:hypothetical protein
MKNKFWRYLNICCLKHLASSQKNSYAADHWTYSEDTKIAARDQEEWHQMI